MYRFAILSTAIFFLGLGLLSRSEGPRVIRDIDKEWIIVDSLEKSGLYRQALEKVSIIYRLARQKEEPTEELKALIFKLRYIHALNVEGFKDAIAELEVERTDSRLVFKAVKTSMLAELYTLYYQNNRWNLFNNKAIEPPDTLHPETWTPEQFGEYIDSLYQESLSKPGALASIGLDGFRGLLVNKPEKSVYFNLLDLLSSRALHFYGMHELDYSEDIFPGLLMDSSLFSSSQRFIEAINKNTGGDTFYERSLGIYAGLLHHHFNDTSEIALIDVELKRLSYVHSIYLNEGSDSLFLRSLDDLSVETESDSLRASVFFEKADFYFKRAENYAINSKDTSLYSGDRLKAAYWARLAKKTSPESSSGIKSENMLVKLLAPSLKIASLKYNIPKRFLPLSVEYSNLTELWYWVTPVSPEKTLGSWFRQEKQSGQVFIEGNSPVASGRFNLNAFQDMNPHRLTVDIPPLLPGNYQLLISGSPNPDNNDDFLSVSYLAISDHAWFTKKDDAGNLVVNIVDRGSGNPLKGVKVTRFKSTYNSGPGENDLIKGGVYYSDEKGRVIIKVNEELSGNYRPETFYLLIGSREYGVFCQNRYGIYNKPEAGDERYVQRIFTDRGIYRPGQEVKFAGLLARDGIDGLEPVKNGPLELYFQDPRYHSIDTLRLTTDESGFFRASLQIPGDAPGGNYRISTRWGQHIIQVEQYKRPGFKIIVHPDSRVYEPGDTLMLRGKAVAFAGIDLKGAFLDIEANLILQDHFGPRLPGFEKKIGIARGSSILDNTGNFKWSVKSRDLPDKFAGSARYEFKIKIRDKNGETRELVHNLMIGAKPVFVNINGPSQVDKRDGGEWKISSASPGVRKVETHIIVKVGILNPVDLRQLPNKLPWPDNHIIKERVWKRRFPRLPYYDDPLKDSIKKMVFHNSYFSGSGGFDLNLDVSGWEVGRYRILAYRQENPSEIIGRFEFDLYDKRLKSFPKNDPVWIALDKNEYQAGDIIEYMLGSRYPGFYLLEITGRDTVFLEEWIALDNLQLKRKLPVVNEMKGNINIHLTGVYENNLFHAGRNVKIPWSDKKIDIILADSLPAYEPGDSARLSFKFLDHEEKPVEFKGVITVYDSSLDEIRKNNWETIGWPVLWPVRPYGSGDFNINYAALIQSPELRLIKEPQIPVIELNWFGLNYYGISRHGRMDMAMQPASREMAIGEPLEGAADGENVIYDLKTDIKAEGQGEQESGMDLSPANEEMPYFRKDFRETAFFNAELRSGPDGIANIAFKVPDAVTVWKVMAFGHDGNMRQALEEFDFQSAKQLMLLPNLPRFVREGDSLNLSVKASWNGHDQISGDAILRIENPVDSTKSFYESATPFNLVPFDQKALVWRFRVPPGIDMARFKISIKAGGYEDGYSAVIPVLARELIFWDAENFFLREPEEISLNINSTGSTILEINSKPLWMAVQSLPVLRDKELPCSEFWFTRFYTARLIEKLRNEKPGLVTAVQKLADEIESNPNLNPFLRNDEIRRFAMNSGLWKGSGREEVSRAIALAESFEPEINQAEMQATLRELSDLQLSDGSWPWFKGMRPDFRMTSFILGGLGQLLEGDLISDDDMPEVMNIAGRAVSALDRTVFERYNRQKITDPEAEPPLTPDIIYYLYARSFFGEIPQQENFIEAYSYYFGQAGEQWSKLSNSQQALIGILYKRQGEDQIPGTILASFIDRKLTSESGGIYWKNSFGAASLYDRDIWQQSLIVEFFSLVGNRNQYTDDMKTWMIQQKRSREWGDRLSTVLAVKTLAFYGSEWESASPQISVTAGAEEISPLRIELGTDASGYYRYEWEGSGESSRIEEIEIRKEGRSPVWGSLFTQNQLSLDSLNPTGDELKIERILLVEEVSKGVKRWVKAGNNALSRGQRLKVRMVVEASQPADYVQIRDYRAAALEPDQSLSGYHWSDGVSWYQAQGDESVDFYIAHLPKGFTYFEYGLYVEQAGEFSRGYSEIQSQYAPEFMARSKGGRLVID